jgi:hypothetical protein
VSVGLATRGVIMPASASIKYRMRAFDTFLGGYVFWTASDVDSDGSDYAGPGPLTDIVVQAVLPRTSI